MAPVLSPSGLTVPGDFPVSQFEAVHKKLAVYGTENEYRLFFGALIAIGYRFEALAEYDDSFTRSINAHGTGPGQPFRYEQDRDLFGFFSNGFSIFDAFCFALFAIGALTRSPEFPLATDEDERKVTWSSTQLAYRKAFPGDPILNALTAITNDAAFKELRDIRNILTHRAVPSRTFGVTIGPSAVPETTTMPRLNMTLDDRTTSSRRGDVARLLFLGLDATHKFVESRL